MILDFGLDKCSEIIAFIDMGKAIGLIYNLCNKFKPDKVKQM